jgi:hypothetical protein
MNYWKSVWFIRYEPLAFSTTQILDKYVQNWKTITTRSCSEIEAENAKERKEQFQQNTIQNMVGRIARLLTISTAHY